MELKEKLINGVRHVLCPENSEWMPDMKYMNETTYILDERPDRFQYYPLCYEPMKPEEITQEMRKELMDTVMESERECRERRERGEYTFAELDFLPLEEDPHDYEQQGECWKKKQPTPNGKYSAMRREYLKNYQPDLYTQMKISNTLNAHLNSVQERTQSQVDTIVEHWKLVEEDYLEAVQQNDFIQTVGLLNNMIRRAEEIVLPQTIYS